MMELPENIITGIDYLALFFQLVGASDHLLWWFPCLYQLWMASIAVRAIFSSYASRRTSSRPWCSVLTSSSSGTR